MKAPPFKAGLFTNELKNQKADKDYPDYINKMVVLDLAEHLGMDKHFILDNHLNSKGHFYIAEELIQTITKLGRKKGRHALPIGF